MAYTINGVEKDTDDDGYLLDSHAHFVLAAE